MPTSLGLGLGLPMRRGAVAAAAPAWTPADVTVSASITWEVLDASGTMYGDVAHTTPITANNDPIGAIPTLRGATIQHRATEFWLPTSSNMTYAPVLKTDDATYSRVVELNDAAIKWVTPNGIFDNAAENLYQSETTYMVGIRIKHLFAVSSANTYLIIMGSDNGSDKRGPGTGVGNLSEPSYVVSAIDATVTDTNVVRVADNVWSTLVMVSNGSGTSLYLDDPVTPISTNPAMTTLQWTGRSLGISTIESATAFRFRRFIVGSNFDGSEAPIAGVMSWLDG